MRECFSKIITALREPGLLISFLTFTFTVLASVGAIVIAILNSTHWLGYIVYALAAILLFYSVYIIVKRAPALKRRAIELIAKSRFGARMLSEHDVRTLTFTSVSFFINIAYAVFNLIAALAASSVRYATLAAYYLLLTFMRGGVLTFHKNGRHKTESAKDAAICKLKNTGIIIMVLSVPVSVAVSFMSRGGEGYDSDGWIIYAVAAFTFTKLTLAIISTVKAKRSSDITIGALASVGLADSAVSVLSLQAALLDTFGDGVNSFAFNVASGAVVTVFIIILGISVILKSKKLKRT